MADDIVCQEVLNKSEDELGKPNLTPIPPPPPTASPNDLGPSAIGRVDWSPLAAITRTRPLVSKYAVQRFSPMEWRKANQALFGSVPSVDSLAYDSKNVIQSVAAELDKQQLENTQRLRKRAAEIFASHDIARKYSQAIKDELEQLAQCKVRIRNALNYLNVVGNINMECREIRKNRLTEDLVRDVVEEELFQENGLVDEVRELYRSALNEFENTFNALKKVSVEIQALWSNQKETLELETENIGLNNTSPHIAFRHGVARFESNMATLELWDKFTKDTLQNVKTTLENSKDFRRKVSLPVIGESAKELTAQGDKVVQAFLQRIDETKSALTELELELFKTLKEIAHCEEMSNEMNNLGRQIDYNLKVVQTRLFNRSKRPESELVRDKAQHGLINEIKEVTQRVTALQQQGQRMNDTIEKLYALRKKLERQIHVKRHTLAIDQQRCMTFRKQFPNPTYMLGF